MRDARLSGVVYSDWSRVSVNGVTLPDALTCWEQGDNEHNGAFRRRPGNGAVGHDDADIYLLTGSRLVYLLITRPHRPHAVPPDA